MNKPLIILTACVGLTLLPTSALEIPLSGGGGGGQGTSKKIAFVDMERIFQIYPQTKAAKEDYIKKRTQMREDLANKEAQLEEVRTKLTVLETTMITQEEPMRDPSENNEPSLEDALFETNDSTATETMDESLTDASPEAVSMMKKELEDLEIEYEESRKRTEEDLVAFENRQTQIILGKIYQALQELAEEEQVDLVVDKSSILYGSATIDLTEKLQQKVRGF